MAKGKGAFKGFLWAVVICLLSFGVIYFFVPSVSERYFGVSFRNGDVSEVMTESSQQVNEIIDNVKAQLKASGATDAQISEVIDKLKESDVWEELKDTTKDGAQAVADFVKDAARSVNLEVGVDAVKNAISKVDFQKLAKNISSFASDAFQSIVNRLK